ncbi:site-specific integrase [Streptomyces sp. MBT49]|uniref:site-specific integrase n=1 Tax=Streptomyces sp. MBT49 TaxID=1488380 RepID=UPI00190A6A2D|nr:site-specific integrase [Streptomyces sp. MBT49]MBK3627463.1 site-specific integrase [Streptomyces sp. MBT49]
MHLIFYSPNEWDTWGLGRRPLIPEGMPVLIDEDLVLEEAGKLRPAAVANSWFRELPISGAPAVRTWKAYAQAVRSWLEFLDDRGVDPFGERDEIRAALSSFSEYRFAGPLESRWDEGTWNLNINTVARFYEWAVDHGHCTVQPFTFAIVRRYTDAGVQQTRRNTATLRQAKPHARVKYLEADFSRMFVRALAGLRPDGEPDGFRGRHLGRNAAMASFVISSGLRSQEFTHLLSYELPTLPARRSAVPIRFPLAAQITKGKKARETWTDYAALLEIRQYMDLDRAAVLAGREYAPDVKLGGPLLVTEPDWEGATVGGRRVSWRKLTLNERLRMVTAEGTPAIIAVQSDGTPFIDWATTFRRTSARIRRDFEPRFPTVTPHVLRHTFAMATLEKLVKGHYARAVALVSDADEDAALALYLTKQDPLLVLRDLLGHTSVTTTEIYLARLDVHRVYRDVYREAGQHSGAATAEAAAEFDEDEDGEGSW